MPALARNRSCKHTGLVRTHLVGRGRPGSIGTHQRRRLEMACPQAVLWIYRMASSLCPVVIAITFCPLVVAFAQESTPTSTPQTAGQPVATTFEVIVTGSNIPTSEEVGPQPVDTYRKADIFRLGARSATDFVQKLPVATGPSINENMNTIGGGQTEIDLRGLGAKGTLVL
jgi:hypothetical protein